MVCESGLRLFDSFGRWRQDPKTTTIRWLRQAITITYEITIFRLKKIRILRKFCLRRQQNRFQRNFTKKFEFWSPYFQRNLCLRRLMYGTRTWKHAFNWFDSYWQRGLADHLALLILFGLLVWFPENSQTGKLRTLVEWPIDPIPRNVFLGFGEAIEIVFQGMGKSIPWNRHSADPP